MRKPSAIKASILENIRYEIAENGKVMNTSLKGKIVVKASRAAKRLQLLLSNAYKMTNIHVAPNVIYSNLPFSRSVVFDLQKGENTILAYDVDLHSAKMPLESNVTIGVEDETFLCEFELKNVMEQSNIMNNSIQDIQSCISISPQPDTETLHFGGRGSATFSEEKGIVWSVDKIPRKNVARLTFRFAPRKIPKKTQVFGSMNVSFELPNRSISGIFIEKIQTSGRILTSEIPANLVYRTECKNLMQKFRSPVFLEGVEQIIPIAELIVTKNATKRNVRIAEKLEIVIGVRNLGKNVTKNLRISDKIPGGLHLTEGRNFWYGRINPGETREISYVVEPKIPGEYVLPPAEVTYESLEGRRRVASSSPLKIFVQAEAHPSTIRTCSKCGAKIPRGAKFCGICGSSTT